MKRQNRLLLAAVSLLVIVSTYAATTFSGRFIAQPNWTHQKTGGSSTLKETFSAFLDWTHTSGTNVNQMGSIILDTYTLTNSETRTIDLDNITDGFGDTIDFQVVRFMALVCPTSNVDAVEMGNALTNQFSTWAGATNHTVKCRPGGMLLYVAPDQSGYLVGDNGNLRLKNTGTNNAAYDLYIGGAE